MVRAHSQREVTRHAASKQSLLESTMSRDINCVEWVAHLLHLGQSLEEGNNEALSSLRQAVAALTSNRAELVIRHNESEDAFLVSATPAIQLPVLFGSHTYGKIRINSKLNGSEYPEVPLPIAHLLAQTCGWIIHTLELSALLRAQAKHVNMHAPGRLTDREQTGVAPISWRGESVR